MEGWVTLTSPSDIKKGLSERLSWRCYHEDTEASRPCPSDVTSRGASPAGAQQLVQHVAGRCPVAAGKPPERSGRPSGLPVWVVGPCGVSEALRRRRLGACRVAVALWAAPQPTKSLNVRRSRGAANVQLS